MVAFALASRESRPLEELHHFAVLHRLRHNPSLDPLNSQCQEGVNIIGLRVLNAMQRALAVPAGGQSIFLKVTPPGLAVENLFIMTQPQGFNPWGYCVFCLVGLCAPGAIRTRDTRFRRAVLYPLSYEGGAGRV